VAPKQRAAGRGSSATSTMTLAPSRSSPSTRSESVVPVHFGGAVIGEIDVDSDQPDAFTARDQAFLEQIAAMIAPAVRAISDACFVRE
jgi:transcriptional regulator with GAF, ATPase, and Fis domain